MIPGKLRRFGMRTVAVAEKEVTHILRDRQILTFALGIPIVMVFLFGFAVTFDVEQDLGVYIEPNVWVLHVVS